MEQKIDISVIMPVYNVEEEYFRTAIESILNQTYTNFEFLIVNDASTNNAEEIVMSYNDPRIIYLKEPEHGGQSKARNRAMKVAKGEYIFFADADDWVDTSALEKTYKKSKEQNLDILLFDSTEYDNKTGAKKLWLTDLKRFPDESVCMDSRHDVILNNLFIINPTCWGKLFRKDFLIENNLFFYEGLIFEDLEYFFRYILEAKRISCLKEELYYYRKNVDMSTMSNGNEKHFDMITILNLVEETLKKHNLFERTRLVFCQSKITLLSIRHKEIRVDLKDRLKEKIKYEIEKMNLKPEEIKIFSGYNKMYIDYFCK